MALQPSELSLVLHDDVDLDRDRGAGRAVPSGRLIGLRRARCPLLRPGPIASAFDAFIVHEEAEDVAQERVRPGLGGVARTLPANDVSTRG